MKKLMIIGAASLVLLVGIVFGAFFAGPLFASAKTGQTPAATTTSYCDQFLQNLAHRLNVSVSTLQQDKAAAFSDVLSQMVKDGKLTQAQADAIKQRVAARAASPRACAAAKMMGGHFMSGQLLRKYKADLLSEVAQGLHLTATQLTSQLQSGQSLSAIATAQHISASQLQTIVTNAVQNVLKKAVSAGDLTQAQANSFSQALQSHPQMLERLLDRHFSHPHDGNDNNSPRPGL